MVLEEKAEKEAMLVPAGTGVVNTRLRALFDEAGWVEEQMHGVESLLLVRQLVEEIDKDCAAVLAKLEAIRQILVNRQAMLCNVTLDAANWINSCRNWGGFLGNCHRPRQRERHGDRPLHIFEGLAIPAQVNYVGKGATCTIWVTARMARWR